MVSSQLHFTVHAAMPRSLRTSFITACSLPAQLACAGCRVQAQHAMHARLIGLADRRINMLTLRPSPACQTAACWCVVGGHMAKSVIAAVPLARVRDIAVGANPSALAMAVTTAVAAAAAAMHTCQVGAHCNNGGDGKRGMRGMQAADACCCTSNSPKTLTVSFAGLALKAALTRTGEAQAAGPRRSSTQSSSVIGVYGSSQSAAP